MNISRKTKSLKISTAEAEIGMYVCNLDRPWQQTPFSVEGFYIRDLNEVKKLKVHCDYVFIDIDKGIAPAENNTLSETSAADISDSVYRGKLAPIKINRSIYSSVVQLRAEMATAEKIYEEILAELAFVMTQAADGNLNSVARIIEINCDMVDSLLRNPDAFVWLVRVRKTDDAPHYYLLRIATWAGLFCRHLGLSKSDVRAVTLSILLKDIGKPKLPGEVLEKIKTAEGEISFNNELNQVTLNNTINLLKGFSEVPPKVVKVIKMYFERVNGSGFPQQLKGDQIFLLSKVASIAGFYDEVTFLPGAKCATQTSQSVSRLYEVRGTQFQDELVVEFIKAVGLYPTGTLVKLTTGEIATVIEQNYERRLKPKILVVVDAEGNALDRLQVVNLFENDKLKQKKSGLEKIDIVEDVEPYKYPIKVTKIRSDYIAMNTKKSFFSRFK